MRYSWVQEPVPLMSAAMNPEKKKNCKLTFLKVIFDYPGARTLSHFNTFILTIHLTSFMLLTCNYASPLAFNIFSESLYTQIQVAEPDV